MTQLEELQKAVEELKGICIQLGNNNVSSNDTEFLKSIIDEFKTNEWFTLSYMQGLSKPHKEYVSRSKGTTACYQTVELGKEFPHLRHTFNPQLNHIVDMLEEIQDSNKEILEKVSSLETKEVVVPSSSKKPTKIEYIPIFG